MFASPRFSSFLFAAFPPPSPYVHHSFLIFSFIPSFPCFITFFSAASSRLPYYSLIFLSFLSFLVVYLSLKVYQSCIFFLLSFSYAGTSTYEYIISLPVFLPPPFRVNNLSLFSPFLPWPYVCHFSPYLPPFLYSSHIFPFFSLLLCFLSISFRFFFLFFHFSSPSPPLSPLSCFCIYRISPCYLSRRCGGVRFRPGGGGGDAGRQEE